MNRRFARAALATVCVTCSWTTAYAQEDQFKRGMDARGDRKWPEVAKLMRM